MGWWQGRGESPRARDVRSGRDVVHIKLLRSLLLDGVRVAVLVVVDASVLAVLAAVLPLAAQAGVDPGSPLLKVAGPSFIAVVVLSVAAMGGYGAGDAWRDPSRMVRAVALAGGTLAVVLGVSGGREVWPWLAALVGFAVPASVAVRLSAAEAVRAVRRRGLLLRRVVVVRDGAGASPALRLDPRSADGLAVEAVLDVDAAGPAPEAAARELEQRLEGGRVDTVLIPGTTAPELLRALCAVCFDRGVCVELMPAAAGVAGVVRPHRWFGLPVLELRPARIPVPSMALKRALDVAISLLGIVALLPLLALIAAAIRLDSPGPILFRQTRVGVGGRPFRMWKFRTMHAGADHEKSELSHLNGSGDPRLFKVSRDPRVTRVGRVLRRTSLDELPQLLNVLRGEMSLVGPRPFFPEDLALYEPHHFERLTVLPGITGLWQVSGRSRILDFNAVVNLDREYIRRWSIGLDVEILLRTIPAVIRREGAY